MESKRHTQPPRGFEDSPMLQVAFDDARQNRYMKMGVCAALYLVLALIWMPGFGWDVDIPIAIENEQPKKRIVLKPPPEKPIERREMRERQNTRVPMPDTTPDDPEPIVEPDPPDAPDLVYSDDNWEIGIPDDVPEQNTGPIMNGGIGVDSPVITKRVKPNYPKRAAKVRLQGYVLVSAIMRKDGSITDVKIIKGLGKGKFGFEEEAMRAVKAWQFIPGKHQGKPADIVLNLKIDFLLN